MARRLATVSAAVASALLAAAIAIARIYSANQNALSTLVWAEDGLFPLCARAHGWLECMVDPYAGYLLLIPRLVAGPVSVAQLDSWPLITTVGAAVVAALAAALAFVIMRASGSGVVAAVLISLLPVLLPILRYEVIAVTASSFVFVIYLGALALSFPPRHWFPTWAFASGLLIAVLTIPSAVVLLLPLAVQMLRGRIPRRGGAISGAALLVGSAMQVVATVATEVHRPIRWDPEVLRSWIELIPNAVLLQLPNRAGLTLGEAFVPPSHWGWGIVAYSFVGALLLCGVVLVVRKGTTSNGTGLLILVGFAAGLVPVLFGGTNNRYFTVPVLLWTAAALIALDRWLPRYREQVISALAVVLVVLWLPGFKASEFRVTAAPEWPTMLATARAGCLQDPTTWVTFVFTPAWPTPDMPLPPPTTNVVDCRVLLDG